MLAQCIYFGYRIGEVSCPTKYFEEASSIGFGRSVKYGFGVLNTTLKCRLQKWGIAKYRMFSPKGRKLVSEYYAPLVEQTQPIVQEPVARAKGQSA
jgi:hypothetical protein